MTGRLLSCLACLGMWLVPWSYSQGEGRPSYQTERGSVDVASPKGRAISRVVINNRLGNVSVRGHDEDRVTVRSVKRALTAEALQRLSVALLPDGEGGVTISTALRPGRESHPVAARGIGVDLVVLVPRTASLKARIWDGTLVVSKVDNGALVTVNEGGLNVSQVSGEVRSDVRKGEQSFVEVFGELHARGLDGDVELRTVHGKRLSARLVRGNVHGLGVKVDAMEIRAVFGDVDIAAIPMPGGVYSISSHHGDVTYEFSGETSVQIGVQAPKTVSDPALQFHKGRLVESGPRVQLSSKASAAVVHLSSGVGTVFVRHF